MSKLPSIRQRLSRALIGISIAWGLVVSTVVWLSVRHAVDELLDNTLQESAEIIYGVLSMHQAQLPFLGGVSLPAPLHEEHLVWQVVGARNEVVMRSHKAPLLPLVARRTPGLSDVDEAWRVYGMPLESDGRILYVAQISRARNEARLEAAGATTGAALVVGLLCAVWLRSRVRQEVAPITAMSASLAHFDPLVSDASLAPATRAELLTMHDAISDLGARLAKRLANERAFSAHAAHALRTPLAGMVAQLAVAQRKSPPEAQPHLASMRQAADKLRRVVAALLTLFRTDNDDLKRQGVDMAELVGSLPFERLSVSVDRPAFVWADPDLLSAALINLFDNAQQHGASHAGVQVQHEGQETRIVVTDNGHGMSAAQQASLQAALDTQHYEGQMGLGLMLVDLIARAHGGHLRLKPVTSGCAMVITVLSGLNAQASQSGAA